MLNDPNRILAEGRQGDKTSSGECWGMRSLMRCPGWSDIKDGGFWLNQLSRILALEDKAQGQA